MTTTIVRRAELAHRVSGGVDVYLYWNVPTSRVTIGVFDERGGSSFAFEADGRHALDAFNHPYAYAARTHDTGSDAKQATINPRRVTHAGTDR